MGVLVNAYRSVLFGVFFYSGIALCSVNATAQSVYLVFGKVTVTEGSIKGVEAQLIFGNEISALSVNDKGEFTSKLQWSQNYLFAFSKKGYIAKSIRFSTEIPVNVSKNAIEPYMLLVELSPVMANVDTAFFENPVGFIRFDSVINDFDFDRDYSLKVKYTAPVQKTKEGKIISAKDKTNKSTSNNQSKKPLERNITVNANKQSKTSGNSTEIPIQSKLSTRPKTLYAPDFPPLLDEYPPGITREEFTVPGRKVTRVVLNNNNYLKVLLKVKHNWGGVFYFINEAPDYFRGISRETFIKLTGGD